jgi:5-methylthioadenosine/S-adenosylhomocysteine deaminase
MKNVDTLITNATILTMNQRNTIIGNAMEKSGFIAIVNGFIADIGNMENCHYNSEKTIDANNNIALPGFINTHSHLIAALGRGMGGESFVNVSGKAMDRFPNRLRQFMNEETCYLASKLALYEMQLSGVTTTIDSQIALKGKEKNFNGTIDALNESGMRAVLMRSSVNRTDFFEHQYHDDAITAHNETERLLQLLPSPLIELGIEAMALHRLEQPLLKELIQIAQDNDLMFGMHLAYSQDAARDPVKRFGKPLLEFLDALGAFNTKFIGYHPVWLSEKEIEIAKNKNIGFAYCPVDNMLIGTGTANLQLLKNSKIGIGLDQPNDSHNFFELMKYAILAQRTIPNNSDYGNPLLALQLGTINGAEAIHKENIIGSLEKGKAADFIILDQNSSLLHPITGMISNIVLAGSPSLIKDVFINGEQIIKDKKHLKWNEADIIQDINRIMKYHIEVDFKKSFEIKK